MQRVRHAQWLGVALVLLALSFALGAAAATPVHIVRTDLRPLIRAAYRNQVQFAVVVPHIASTVTDGTWSISGGTATWRYTVQVPTAVSLSFHAVRSALPGSALLVVSSAKTITHYGAAAVHHSELWSRIQPGDSLEFTLTVAEAERSQVALNLVSLQAGYRSLGAGVSDHPYYRQLLTRSSAGSDNTACVTNYECEVTPANTPAGAATVGVSIGNAIYCTASLINDVPTDNTPYLLTARHCENGRLGAGEPGAAASVTVYWDATTGCGTTLGSLYDPGIVTQTGAQTVVEQQDAWLMLLDQNPVVADAQFAGFDASGAAVLGGYSVHHALSQNKQFTAWNGQALALQESAVLGTTYESNFLETVNAMGNIAPGASGGALFDQNNRLVGSLTLGRSGDSSGYGSCPATPLVAPNGNNGVADFTSLAAVWDSTADTTSNTGTTTLKSILDPANTGTLVVGSMPVAAITFTASAVSIDTSSPLQLQWSVPRASQCSGSGGLPGDGWPGNTLAASGTQTVTEGSAGDVTYKLTCQLNGGGSVSANVRIAWDGSVPFVDISPSLERTQYWVSRPVTLNWTSNVSPCTITGGGLSLSGLAASGSTTTTQSTPGDVTYHISCGSAAAGSTSSQTVTYVTPSLAFASSQTDVRQGVSFELGWQTDADVCTPSGGAPNDGWSQSSFGWTSVTFYPRVTTPGTYTYTLNCTAGALSEQASVTVTVENNAPYVTTSITPTTVTYSDTPSDYLTASWTSNLDSCQWINLPGPVTALDQPVSSLNIISPITVAPTAPGTYTVTMTCLAVGVQGSVTFDSHHGDRTPTPSTDRHGVPQSRFGHSGTDDDAELVVDEHQQLRAHRKRCGHWWRQLVVSPLGQ